MKLSEIIKELEKDDTKIFVSKNKPFVEMKCQSQNEVIEFFRDNSIYAGNINIKREWQEIKKPITFDEVLNNGKNFRCEHPKIKDDYFILSRFIEHLYINDFNSDEIADILNTGKFYN